MGSVVSSFRILPSDTETDLEALKAAIKAAMPEEAHVHRFSEEPIAFVLVALNVDIVIPEDMPGEMDKIEEILHNVDGVSQIDTLMVRRLSGFHK